MTSNTITIVGTVLHAPRMANSSGESVCVFPVSLSDDGGDASAQSIEVIVMEPQAAEAYQVIRFGSRVAVIGRIFQSRFRDPQTDMVRMIHRVKAVEVMLSLTTAMGTIAQLAALSAATDEETTDEPVARDHRFPIAAPADSARRQFPPTRFA